GVQDVFGTISNSEGIKVAELSNYMLQNKGSIADYLLAAAIESDQYFGLEFDICIHAALGDQITAKNADSIKAMLVAEGANGPIDIEGEKILLNKGIGIIPDILCNSGGVIGSYFEWLQNRNGEIWQMDEVMDRLEKQLNGVFGRVCDKAEKRKCDLRSAAYVIAIERIEKAYVQRGIFP